MKEFKDEEIDDEQNYENDPRWVYNRNFTLCDTFLKLKMETSIYIYIYIYYFIVLDRSLNMIS